jgi:transposase
MGRGIKLSDTEVDQLDRLRFTTDSADIYRNCLIILMSDAGDTIAAIAKRPGCTTFTVNRVRRLYRQAGIDALRPIKPPGHPSRATPEFLAAMKQAIATSPLSFGYGFSNWSAIRLAAHLAQVTGTRFSDDQMRRLLHQEGYSVHRPKHTMKGKRDEEAYENAKKQLRRLIKSAEGGCPGGTGLPRRGRDPSASGLIANVGTGGNAAGDPGARPEREEGRLRWRRLRDGQDHVHDCREQERNELPDLLGRAGQGVRQPQGLLRL